MKIVREVYGRQFEFELTERELFDAHRAQEHIWDVHYIEGMFGVDERFDDMDEEDKKEALDDIAWDYRERLNDSEVKDEFEIASEAFEKYFEEREGTLDGRLASAQERSEAQDAVGMNKDDGLALN